ncbi:MAG: N-acetylglucosamine-6-phosphate deacetylase [Planctomycetales bacterium]|nr:N-acetylglucosamine-6-phosphate deacetylase [Planctomycetales bacterium]
MTWHPKHAFLDLQVNGYAGVDFNGDDWTESQLEEACRRLQQDGVAGILATVITDSVEAMTHRLHRLAVARSHHAMIAETIAGFHIEGPFLNETRGYIGAHPAAHAQPATIKVMRQLLDAAAGMTRIVTLAPERDPQHVVTRMLAEEGVVVSAGHCNPSLDELDAAINAGLSMVTHLGNGCPLELHRHDNFIQRALSRAERLWIGFIADGVHVPFFALANYLKAAGIERCFIVTDAISAAGQGPGQFKLGNQDVIVDENLATWAADRSHLMGSAGTMPRTANNLRHEMELPEADVAKLLVENPRRAIGWEDA